MGKYCGRGNEQLDEKALDVYHVAEGEGGAENPSRLTGLRISFEMLRIYENRSLSKEVLHVLIHHLIMHLTIHKRSYVAHAFWNSAA